MTISTQDAFADRAKAHLRNWGADTRHGHVEMLTAFAEAEALRAPRQPLEADLAATLDRIVTEYQVNHGSTFCKNLAEAALRWYRMRPATPPSPQETRRALEAELPVTMLVDATVKLNGLLDRYWEGNNSKTQIIAMCASQQECKQAVELLAKAALSTSPAPAEDYPFFECPGCGRDIAESGTVCAPNCPRAAEDVRALEKIANQISAKVVQLEHYRDNGCQLDHARIIAEGRILQGIQILRWVTEALTSPDPKQAMQDGGER